MNTLRYWIRLLAIGGSALVAATIVALAVNPALRQALTATMNDPSGLPALGTDARIRYEPEALDCAREIASILPTAITKIENAHGRVFAKSPLVAVYKTFDIYARANGLGDAGVAGVSRAGRALLSPTLCRDEHDRLASVLTHELSHVHFFGWRSRTARRPPQWFTEGLAVFASDGGAAEGVSDARAAQAIRDGHRIVLNDKTWMNFAAIDFEKEPRNDSSLNNETFRQRLAFRQAAIFISWLREKNAAAFMSFLRGLESGADFDGAFRTNFAATANEQWKGFVEQLSK